MWKKLTKNLTNPMWWVKLGILTVSTVVVVLLINWITGFLQGFSTTFASAIAFLIGAIALMYGLYLRKGKESFVETLPMLLIIGAIAGIGASFFTWMSVLSLDVMSFVTLAEFLGAYYISDAVISRWM